jgi:hypothetical protein
VLGIILGLSFGGWDSSDAVHEALLVVLMWVIVSSGAVTRRWCRGDEVGGDVFDVAEGAQRAAAKPGIRDRWIGP